MNESTYKPRHGGNRQGSGRKHGQGPFGEATVAMRVPASQVEVLRAWLETRKKDHQDLAPGTGKYLDWIGPADLEPDSQTRPLFISKVPAGFPSPADDYVEERVDLNAHLIKHPSATFFLRVKGESMTGAGIFDNDLVIVDRSLDPMSGSVVIAVIDGELTIKRLVLIPGGEVELRP